MGNSVNIDRKNNFDFIRLVLASLVIISHSYPLTANEEVIFLLTDRQEDLGSFAVNSFFALSGYFIFLSLQRSKSVSNYLWKRILRLFPALIVLMIFTLALLPFLYEGTHFVALIKDYCYYAWGALSLYNTQYYIKGIFENNLYKGAINGSLWTLAYEFSLYILVMLLFFIRNSKTSYILLSGGLIISYLLMNFYPNFLINIFSKINLLSVEFYRLATYFLAGSCLTILNLKKFNSLVLRLALVAALILSFIFHFYNAVAPLILPLLLILVGALNTTSIERITGRLGDLSYGVYIYGFLVQQTFMNYYNWSPGILMILSLVATYFLAYLSWHLVEKKMLNFKNLIR